MRRIAIVLSLTSLTGCATLFGGGPNQSVNIQSAPASANFVVKAGSGIQMAAGKTPMSVSLPRKNEYQIDITTPGFQTQHLTLTKGINGWVFVNLLNGIIGFGVDFLSGAAYKLEPALVSVTLQAGTGDAAGLTFSHVQVFSKDNKLIQEHTEVLVPLPK